MVEEENHAEWNEKGATLSDKSAEKEFGISREKIRKAINGGILQYRINYVYENPYFKLLRREVEALVIEIYGKNYLEKNKIDCELAKVNKELKRLKKQAFELEQKRAALR